MKRKIFSTVLAILFISDCSFAQSVSENSVIQDSLSRLSALIWKQKTDSARLQTNNIFFVKFQSVLESGSSASFTFDSIYGITRVTSADGNLSIYTWNVPLSNGTNKYFGFLQLKQDISILIPLQSNDNNVADLDTKQLTPQTWYGAIYYKLIEVEINGQKAYTLLGWDGYTATSNRKFIDIVSPDSNGNLQFGMPVFKTSKGIKDRLIFEYAEKATMLLRYDYQAIMVEKKKKIRKENNWLIVMDRMVPMDPSMTGFRKYYVPAGDTYDGYIFRNGYWTLVENIDIANKSVPVK
jgi:hypothetical protein